MMDTVLLLYHFCSLLESVGRTTRCSWLLLHDNTPAHNALSILQFLAEKNIAVLEQPPYSPHLALWNVFLLPKLKEESKAEFMVSA
uniref:Tc1-like transposase DDE domain-containing protein n=1 Tax=Stegastes partitus TaxID=144197 RepID=A0A3B5B9X7_9TELE